MIQKYLNGIKINSIEGAKILKANGEVPQISGQAIFSYSMLLDELINQVGENNLIRSGKIGFNTRDIINVKFDFGLKAEEIKVLNYDWLNKLAEENTKSNLEELKKKKLEEVEKKDFIENKENIEEYRQALKEKAIKKYNERIIEIEKISERKILERKKYNADKYKESAKIKLQNKLEEISIKNKFNKELSIEKIKNMEVKDIDNLGAEAIRDYLYENGFVIDYPIFKKDKETKEYKQEGIKRIKYKFWFRSCAKARIGEMLFINEAYYDEIVKWQMMNIEMELNKPCKLVEMTAYMSLTASSIEGSINIKPNEILVIDDLESTLEKDILDVVVENEKCVVREEVKEVKNILFDGQALLDDSLFTDNAGMMLLRHHMFKACGFRTYISKFMKDNFKDEYETATVKDRYGNDIKVKDIKMITTENAMKFEKFFDNKSEGFNKWKIAVENDGCEFGVVKRDHQSRFGEHQIISYQMLNSLMLNKEETRFLFNETREFINLLKDNDKYIEYLKNNASDLNENDMIIDLVNLNNKFTETDVFRTQKSKVLKELRKTLQEGRIRVNGDNLTVVGNPYKMLKASIGDRELVDETLSINENNDYISVYTKRFKDGEMLAGFRNPFNAPNNLSYFKNETKDSLINKYFNFSNNIIAINLIKTDAQDRNNGMDADSDFMLVTNNALIVNKAKSIYKEYKTIVNSIEKSNKEYIYNQKSMSTIDNTLSKAKDDIGVSSNLAQIALSHYSDSFDKEMRDTFVIMSVLAQVAIDNAKRQYNVNIEKECNRLSIKVLKPLFFKYIQENDDIEKYMNANEKKLLNTKKDMLYLLDRRNDEYRKKEKEYNEELKKIKKRIKTDKKKRIDELTNFYTEEYKNKNLMLDLREIQNNSNCQEFKDYLEDRIEMLRNKNVHKKVKKNMIKARAKFEAEENFDCNINCAMNHIQFIIEEEVEKASRGSNTSSTITMLSLLKNEEGKAKNSQVKEVVELVSEWDNYTKAFFDKENTTDEEKEDFDRINEEYFTSICETLGKRKMKDKTVQMILKNTLLDNNKKASTSHIRLKTLKVMYKCYKSQFLNMFKEEIA